MKNPDTSEHICDTPVIASAEEGWYYLNYVLSPPLPLNLFALTFLHNMTQLYI